MLACGTPNPAAFGSNLAYYFGKLINLLYFSYLIKMMVCDYTEIYAWKEFYQSKESSKKDEKKKKSYF